MKIGIIGAGQLGRMLALAGYPLGNQFRFLWNERSEACDGLGEFAISDLNSPDIKAFCSGLDCATYEFENLPTPIIEQISKSVPLFPGAKAISIAQDRINEKGFFSALGIPTPKFLAVDSLQDMQNAASELELPFILKTRTLGYDGKGQIIVRSSDSLAQAFASLGNKNLIAEEFIKFDRELSVIGVRAKSGEIKIYPLFQNTHRDGILFRTEFPASNISEATLKQAENFILSIMQNLDYVGVLALELFEKNGALLANEMAPRVHNSGHVTIEAAVTSQFENHIRAISDLPLGSTEAICKGVMINLIGKIPTIKDLAAIPGLKIHNYGKAERAGRKLGHITLLNPSSDAEKRVLALLGAQT